MPDNPRKATDETALEVTVPDGPPPPPEAANWFRLARVGQEVQLLVGFIDLGAIHVAVSAAKTGSKPDPVPVEVSHRFVVPMIGARMLQDAINTILKNVDARGGEES